MRKYRGKGVVEAIALDMFQQFPGRWRVSQTPENITAQHFWRTAVGRYTQGEFTKGLNAIGRTTLDFSSAVIDG